MQNKIYIFLIIQCNLLESAVYQILVLHHCRWSNFTNYNLICSHVKQFGNTSLDTMAQIVGI